MCCPANGTGLITKRNQRTPAVISPPGKQGKEPLVWASLAGKFRQFECILGCGKQPCSKTLREYCPPAPQHLSSEGVAAI